MGYSYLPRDKDIPKLFQGDIDVSIVQLPSGKYAMIDHPIDMAPMLQLNGRAYCSTEFATPLRIRGISEETYEMLKDPLFEHCSVLNEPNHALLQSASVDELSQLARKACVDTLRMLQDEEYDEDMNDSLEIPEMFRGNRCMSIVRLKDEQMQEEDGSRFNTIYHSIDEKTYTLPSGLVINIEELAVIQVHGINEKAEEELRAEINIYLATLNTFHQEFYSAHVFADMKENLLSTLWMLSQQ